MKIKCHFCLHHSYLLGILDAQKDKHADSVFNFTFGESIRVSWAWNATKYVSLDTWRQAKLTRSLAGEVISHHKGVVMCAALLRDTPMETLRVGIRL